MTDKMTEPEPKYGEWVTYRCEGWRRHGGAFTFGPVKWEQCENDATVMLTVIQDGKQTVQPACQECWQEGSDNEKIKVMKVELIADD